MDRMNLLNKASVLLNKYKYVLAILLLGMVLMLIPNHKDDNSSEQQPVQESKTFPITPVKDELTEILSQIEDVGKVQVMLSLANGEETIFQTNSSTQDSGSNYTTVIVTDSERNQHGLVQQIKPPVYLGAIVICQGWDKPAVRLAVTQAVSKITGLGADSISVLKMK